LTSIESLLIIEVGLPISYVGKEVKRDEKGDIVEGGCVLGRHEESG